MVTYVLTNATLTFNYNFGFILPMLQLPGGTNPAFQLLVKELKPFKVSASNISIENTSNKLGDLVMIIGLLDNQIVSRISYEYFDLIVLDLHRIQTPYTDVIPKILEALCNSFKNIPIEFAQGLAKIQWTGHLQLEQPIPETFISKSSFQNTDQSIQLITNANVYKLQIKENSPIVNSMLVIAKSETQNNSIVLELTLTYRTINEPVNIINYFVKDLDNIMNLLNLTPGSFPDLIAPTN